GRDVYTGFAQIEAMRNALGAALEGLDYMLSPTAPTPSYPAEWPSPVNDPQKPFEHIGFTVAANMGGQPAISINCGYAPDGLPIGLQIIGQPFDDLGVLRVARAYEQMRPAQRPWPTL
ncbi:amidase, partial [Salmonella enterica subsp. enterica serovar Enteritidis]|nr:amidase [Salmonella enterica subsp. enterica serovar Enteritidis]